MTTKRGKAAAIVPSEMKGRKRPMTDDEFLWLLDAEDVVEHLQGDGYVIVRKRAIGDALSDAIMEATNQGWNDPDSAIWRRGMAAGHRTLGLAWPGDLDPVGGGE